jgi:hypothetical protein
MLDTINDIAKGTGGACSAMPRALCKNHFTSKKEISKRHVYREGYVPRAVGLVFGLTLLDR